MTDLRGGAREVAAAVQQHSRNATVIAEDVTELGSQMELIRRSTADGAEALAVISEVLEEMAGNRKGGRPQPEHT
jgi:hypothetical protein